jgi:prepilin-type N-terminal cleavage/methylation domain-containing protein
VSRLRGARERTDDGFTAIELLVVIAIMGAVMAMVTSSVVTTMQNQRRQLERLEALNEVKTALHRVTRDVRGANPLVGPLEADSVTMTVVRGGEERTVTFRLDGDVLAMDETNPLSTFTHTLATDLDAATTGFRYFDQAGTELAPPAAVTSVAVVEVRLRRGLAEETDLEFSDRITVRNTQG